MQENNAAGKAEGTDPDDAPELTDQFFDDAEYWRGDTFVRRGRGRPGGGDAGESVNLHLDQEVLAKLCESGPGWQSRVNGILRKAILGD